MVFCTGWWVLNFHIHDGSTGVFLPQAPFAPAVGQWYHLALTRKGTVLQFMLMVFQLPLLQTAGQSRMRMLL